MKIKPIQIAFCKGTMYALCNDGSIWAMTDGVWTKQPGIKSVDHEESSGIEDQAIVSDAAEIIDFLNQKTGKSYRPHGVNLDLVKQRLKTSGVQDIKSMIALKARQWKGTDMEKYLRPATLFNRTKFEQYIGELVNVEVL